MNRFRIIPLTIASLCLCFFTLSGFTNLPTENLPTIEEQVLQIIRDHPEVILESVQAYQQRKQEEIQQRRQAFLQQMFTKPVSVIGNSPTTGATDNKIVLVEFSDFQCPFCAQAHQTVKEFIDKHGDKVTFTYKNLPLISIHPQALPAAKAAWAAFQQGKFWEYEDALFQQQDKLGEQLYIAIAEILDLDLEQFNRDRNSQVATAAIAEDLNLAQTLAINGTPFFLLNDQILPNPLKIEEMESILARFP
ncbi:MAG: thioredoxin domain-containing protein [Moorea sp. SIO2B7]|nr:thioredoxin domain-containing protein [Moorena sp. SIO2B7]